MAIEAPTLDQEDVKCVIAARMPIRALTTEWSLGRNRPVDARHVQRLSKRFLSEGGPKRDAKENHLKVLCSGDDLTKMLEAVGLTVTDASRGYTMPDFTDWLRVNGGRKAEVADGQHRLRGLEVFAKQAELGEEELWWPCDFYDRGTSRSAAYGYTI